MTPEDPKPALSPLEEAIGASLRAAIDLVVTPSHEREAAADAMARALSSGRALQAQLTALDHVVRAATEHVRVMGSMQTGAAQRTASLVALDDAILGLRAAQRGPFTVVVAAPESPEARGS